MKEKKNISSEPGDDDLEPWRIMISFEPGDDSVKKGWRSPKINFGGGVMPKSDERRRFHAHPINRQAYGLGMRSLLMTLLTWLVAAALLVFYLISIIMFHSNPSTVCWIGLSLILLAIVLTVSTLRKGKAYKRALQQYLRNSTHEEATECIKRYLTDGKPYALYFRSFHLEAGIITLPNNTKLSYQLPTPGIERRLASALEEELSLIAFDNPSYVMRPTRPAIPCLCVGPDTWLDWLQDLIWASSLIVIYFDAVSEGVLDELKLTALLQKSDKTIVILPTDSETVTGMEITRARLSMLGAPLQKYKPLTKDAACLKGFKYIFYEDEIDFNRLENIRGFREILSEARKWGRELQRRLTGPVKMFENLIPVDMKEP